ncbi:hypothetical protein F5887DRAFT_355594 [Amanita rubescens]|nr:hypothetical protein F5887DRAFT_355594 [Amanita rubescens]
MATTWIAASIAEESSGALAPAKNAVEVWNLSLQRLFLQHSRRSSRNASKLRQMSCPQQRLHKVAQWNSEALPSIRPVLILHRLLSCFLADVVHVGGGLSLIWRIRLLYDWLRASFFIFNASSNFLCMKYASRAVPSITRTSPIFVIESCPMHPLEILLHTIHIQLQAHLPRSYLSSRNVRLRT